MMNNNNNAIHNNNNNNGNNNNSITTPPNNETSIVNNSGITTPPPHMMMMIQQQSPILPIDESQRTVRLSTVIHRLVEQSYNRLIELSVNLVNQSDLERKKQLADYFEETRERFVRLLVVIKWSKHVNTLNQVNKIMELLNQQDSYLREAADLLIISKDGMVNSRAPVYDVNTAIDILANGNYMRMPKQIEEIIPPQPLTTNEIQTAKEKLNQIILYKLFLSEIPTDIQQPVRVQDGAALIVVPDEYEATITIEGANETSPWIIRDFQIYVLKQREAEAPLIKTAVDQRLAQLTERIQNRLLSSDKPLYELHNIIHYLVITSKLELLTSQTYNNITLKNQPTSSTQNSRGNNNIRAIYGRDQSITIFYWIPDEFMTAKSNLDPNTHTNIKIFLQDESKLLITHTPSIQHPTLENYLRIFTLNIEEILLRAIKLHSFHRVNTLYQHLIQSNSEFSLVASLIQSIALESSSSKSTYNNYSNCPIPDDVINDTLPTVLRVKLYGSNELVVAINSHNGKYIITPNHLLSTDLQLQMEFKLNIDYKEITNIVNQLLLKSLLSCFVESSKFLKLECFYKLPLTCDLFVADNNYICIRLPKDKDLYYIVVTVNTTTFYPSFNLVTFKSNSQSSIMQHSSTTAIETDKLNRLIGKLNDIASKLPEKFQYYLIELLQKVVNATKKRISVKTAIETFNSNNQPFTHNTNLDIITFLYNSPNSLINVKDSTMTLSLPNEYSCNITFYESNTNQHYEFTPNSIATSNSSSSSSSSSQSITSPHFSFENGLWSFTYSTSIDWFKEFKNDLFIINKMIQLSIVVNHYIESIAKSEITDHLQILSIKPMEIEFICSRNLPSITNIKIYVDKNQKYAIEYQQHPSPFLSLLERHLNEIPFQSLITQQPTTLQKSSYNIINNINSISNHLEQFFKSIVFTNDIIYSIHMVITYDTPQYFLPLEIMIIPRSMTQLRLVYKNTYGIDIRAISPENCSIEDAFYPSQTLGSNVSSKFRLHYTPNFHFIMEYRIGVPALDIYFGQRSSWLAPIKHLRSTLQKIIFYYHIVSISKHFQGILKPDLPALTFKFETESMFYQIAARDFSTFELEIFPKDPKLLAVRNELTVLPIYFKKKVNSLSFRIQTITSFLQIFTTPSMVMSELLRILKGDPNSPIKYVMDIHTSNSKIKDVLIHKKDQTTLYFIMRYFIRTSDSSLPISNDLLVDIPLIFNYQRNHIRFWNTSDRANPDSTNNLNSKDLANRSVIELVQRDLESVMKPDKPSALYLFVTSVVGYTENLKGTEVQPSSSSSHLPPPSNQQQQQQQNQPSITATTTTTTITTK